MEIAPKWTKSADEVNWGLTKKNSAWDQMTIRWKKNIETGIKVKNFNIRRAKKMIGFNPKVSLDEGLIKTIEWYKKWDAKKN